MILNKYLRKIRHGHIAYINPNPNIKLHYLSYIPKNVSTILDVGCGRGELLYLLKQKGYKVSGCDMDDKIIKIAKQFCKDIIFADAEQLTIFYSLNKFDLVSLIHVLEHLPNPLKGLLEAKAITNKYILLAVPNARYIISGERDTHLYSWNYFTLKNLLKKAGLTIIKLSENHINLMPNIIRASPIINRIIIRLFWNPMEIIALVHK